MFVNQSRQAISPYFDALTLEVSGHCLRLIDMKNLERFAGRKADTQSSRRFRGAWAMEESLSNEFEFGMKEEFGMPMLMKMD